MIKLVSVVVPTFNEGEAIEHNLLSILSALEAIGDTDFELLVVDDGSVDDTADKVRRLCDEHPKLNLLCLNRNFGKEAAVHAGLTHAHGDAGPCRRYRRRTRRLPRTASKLSRIKERI